MNDGNAFLEDRVDPTIQNVTKLTKTSMIYMFFCSLFSTFVLIHITLFNATVADPFESYSKACIPTLKYCSLDQTVTKCFNFVFEGSQKNFCTVSENQCLYFKDSCIPQGRVYAGKLWALSVYISGSTISAKHVNGTRTKVSLKKRFFPLKPLLVAWIIFFTYFPLVGLYVTTLWLPKDEDEKGNGWDLYYLSSLFTGSYSMIRGTIQDQNIFEGEQHIILKWLTIIMMLVFGFVNAALLFPIDAYTQTTSLWPFLLSITDLKSTYFGRRIVGQITVKMSSPEEQHAILAHDHEEINNDEKKKMSKVRLKRLEKAQL